MHTHKHKIEKAKEDHLQESGLTKNLNKISKRKAPYF